MNTISIENKIFEKIKSICIEATTSSCNAFQTLFESKIDVINCKMTLISPNKMHEMQGFPEDVYFSVLFNTKDINAAFLVTYSENSKKLIIDKSNYKEIIKTNENSFFIEISNILVGNILLRINKTISTKMEQSVPSISDNMIKTTIDEVASMYAVDNNNLLVFMCDYILEKSIETKISVMIIFPSESIEILQNRI